MRTDISLYRFGRLYRLDYKKLIIIVFLLRFIAASAYDICVTLTDKDFLLPDGKFYSVQGKYLALQLEGYDSRSIAIDLLPNDRVGREIFMDIWRKEKCALPFSMDESSIYYYIVGFLYFIFGYSTIWVRIFNICVSILSVYLLFKVARRQFGDLAANLFLIMALFLPTQFIYSITLSRDFLRIFALSLMIWVVYNAEDIWVKKLKPRFYF